MTKNRRIGKSPQYKQVVVRTPIGNMYSDSLITEDDFMQTSVWRDIRRERILKDKLKCSCCGSPLQLRVHHIRYPEVWGEEEIDDLITLCDNCHEEVHSK